MPLHNLNKKASNALGRFITANEGRLRYTGRLNNYLDMFIANKLNNRLLRLPALLKGNVKQLRWIPHSYDIALGKWDKLHRHGKYIADPTKPSLNIRLLLIAKTDPNFMYKGGPLDLSREYNKGLALYGSRWFDVSYPLYTQPLLYRLPKSKLRYRGAPIKLGPHLGAASKDPNYVPTYDLRGDTDVGRTYEFVFDNTSGPYNLIFGNKYFESLDGRTLVPFLRKDPIKPPDRLHKLVGDRLLLVLNSGNREMMQWRPLNAKTFPDNYKKLTLMQAIKRRWYNYKHRNN